MTRLEVHLATLAMDALMGRRSYWCDECRCVTNHTTTQHRIAEQEQERREG